MCTSVFEVWYFVGLKRLIKDVFISFQRVKCLIQTAQCFQAKAVLNFYWSWYLEFAFNLHLPMARHHVHHKTNGGQEVHACLAIGIPVILACTERLAHQSLDR